MQRVLNPAQATPEVVAPLVPVWLAVERDYANSKYGDKNIQETALEGGLAYGGAARSEFEAYFDSRFKLWRRFMDNPSLSTMDPEELALSASQALGKYASTGRSLLSIMVEQRDDCDRRQADETVAKILAEDAPFMASQKPWTPGRQLAIHDLGTIPLLEGIDDRIKVEDWPTAARWANALVVVQSKLFVSYTCEVGMIAQPGVNSSAETIGHWER